MLSDCAAMATLTLYVMTLNDKQDVRSFQIMGHELGLDYRALGLLMCLKHRVFVSAHV